MARKKYDLAVKVGEYTDSSGQTKARYQNIGAVLEKDDGGKFIMIARWFNPAGLPDFNGKSGESVLVSMFEPKQVNQQSQSSPPPAPPPAQNQEGDIPF